LGDLPELARLFIATGVPAIGLIPMGFVMVPNMVGQQRIAGTYDFIWSLPVPRLAAAASTFTVFTLMALPGFVSSLLVALWYYDVSLNVSWLIMPAVLLTALMSASVGFGLAHAIKNPVVINFIANMVIFFVLLFSPIIVPISQFPDWLESVNRILPFYHMAHVIRDALTEGLVPDVLASYFALGVWTVAGWTTTGWVIGRRD
jgi:ABC-2 type transport system permease protein